MKVNIILFLTGLMYWSQSPGLPAGGNVLYIINNKAKMPVIVRGNIQSKVMIVFLHGGPGGTSMKKIGTNAFRRLEEKFSVVYCDQRGSVFSEGGDKKRIFEP